MANPWLIPGEDTFFFPPLVTGLSLPLSRDFLIYTVTAQILLRLPCGGDFIGVALAS